MNEDYTAAITISPTRILVSQYQHYKLAHLYTFDHLS